MAGRNLTGKTSYRQGGIRRQTASLCWKMGCGAMFLVGRDAKRRAPLHVAAKHFPAHYNFTHSPGSLP
jgi:hypothetical protein